MYQIFEQINELRREMRGRRRGYYASRVTDALQSLKRVQHLPEWLAEGAIDNAKRISSPLVDVIPAVGTRLAMISQDGDPDRPAWFGQVWDELAEQMTAWLRANLAEHPGHLELGAENGLTIIIGEQRLDITPENGVLRIEAKGGGKILVKADLVEIGGEALSTGVARADRVETRLIALETWAQAHLHNDTVGPLIPGPPAPTTPPTVPPPSTSAGDTACDNIKGK
jgi:hypothetical protein